MTRPRAEVLLGLAAMLVSLAASTATAAPSEDELKAAFVMRLVNFVSWPEAAGDDAVDIAVVGAPDVAAALAPMVQGKAVGDRPLVVAKDWAESAPPEVAYLGTAEEIDRRRPALRGRPTLTISSVRGFARGGGMIELVREGDRIHLEVNRGAAEEAGLQISSRVLGLARVVHD